MLLALHGDRKREVLPEDISTWPVPCDSKRWALTLSFSYQEEEEDEYLQAQHIQAKLEAALTRQDVDTLKLFHTSIPSPTLKDLVSRLLVQDRDWKVHYFWTRESNLECDLTWLALFQPTVDCLAFTWYHLGEAKIALEPMLPALKAMSNLGQLDFTGISFRLDDFLSLCQDDFLASRISRISLSLHPGDDTFPTNSSLLLPNLTSFTLRVKEEGVSPTVKTQCIQQICQLQSLQSLTINDPFTVVQDETFFDILSDCIRSPSCPLRALELDLNHTSLSSPSQQLPHQSVVPSCFQTFLDALGENGSIQHLSFSLGKNSFGILTSLLSPLTNPTSRINHLELLCYRVPMEESPVICDLLLQWQILMRDTRFLCIRMISWNVRSAKITYATRVHARWLQWQSYLREGLASPAIALHHVEQEDTRSIPSLAQMDRMFWANELERCDQTNDPKLRSSSLDAMYFLLQHWLSGVSDVPSSSV